MPLESCREKRARIVICLLNEAEAIEHSTSKRDATLLRSLKAIVAAFANAESRSQSMAESAS
jgi:hypothetical protein